MPENRNPIIQHDRGKKHTQNPAYAPNSVKGTDDFLLKFLLNGDGLCVDGNINDTECDGKKDERNNDSKNGKSPTQRK